MSTCSPNRPLHHSLVVTRHGMEQEAASTNSMTSMVDTMTGMVDAMAGMVSEGVWSDGRHGFMIDSALAASSSHSRLRLAPAPYRLLRPYMPSKAPPTPISSYNKNVSAIEMENDAQAERRKDPMVEEPEAELADSRRPFLDHYKEGTKPILELNGSNE